MLHIRHILCKTVRNGLFRFILCLMLLSFLYFLSCPLSFAPSFVHYFLPFFFIPFYPSLRSPFFPLCFFCKHISPCTFAIEHMAKRRLSAILGRYVTIHACGFGHCALTEFYVIYRYFGSSIFVWGAVALLKRRVRNVLSWFWVIGCLFCFVVLLIMTMYWHADTCITSRFFLQLRFFAALCLIDLPIQPGGLLQVH